MRAGDNGGERDSRPARSVYGGGGATPSQAILAQTVQDLFKYESRKHPLATRQRYLRRLAQSVLAALLIIGVSLLIGILGYAHFEGMGWLDAFLNASMILSGMGPADTLKTSGGKLFAGCYAIYSGLMVIFVTGIVLAPLAHRVLHRFHVDDKDIDQRRH